METDNGPFTTKHKYKHAIKFTFMPMKETGHNTPTPLDCHEMNIDWFSPIDELPCDQNLKIHEIWRSTAGCLFR